MLEYTGKLKRTIYAYEDIYYVPKSKAQDFLTIATIFFKNRGYVGVAVPYTLICIDQGNFNSIDGIAQASIKTRKQPWENIDIMYRNKNYIFYHAAKWTGVLHKNKLYQKLYCDTWQNILQY